MSQIHNCKFELAKSHDQNELKRFASSRRPFISEILI